MEVHPSKGHVFTKFEANVIHRLSGIPNCPRDYDLNDDGTVKPYQLGENELKWSNKRHPKGISCFIPIEVPHGHFGKSPPPNCFTTGGELPHNWQAVFTHKMKLRLVDRSITEAYHYNLYSIVPISEEEFVSAVENKRWTWLPCELRGESCLADSLYFEKDCEDLEPEIRTLLCHLSRWYTSESNLTMKLLINDTYTWIATEKPSLDELVDNYVRYDLVKYYANNYCSVEESDAQSVADLNDILLQLEDIEDTSTFHDVKEHIPRKVGQNDIRKLELGDDQEMNPNKSFNILTASSRGLCIGGKFEDWDYLTIDEDIRKNEVVKMTEEIGLNVVLNSKFNFICSEEDIFKKYIFCKDIVLTSLRSYDDTVVPTAVILTTGSKLFYAKNSYDNDPLPLLVAGDMHKLELVKCEPPAFSLDQSSNFVNEIRIDSRTVWSGEPTTFSTIKDLASSVKSKMKVHDEKNTEVEFFIKSDYMDSRGFVNDVPLEMYNFPVEFRFLCPRHQCSQMLPIAEVEVVSCVENIEGMVDTCSSHNI